MVGGGGGIGVVAMMTMMMMIIIKARSPRLTLSICVMNSPSCEDEGKSGNNDGWLRMGVREGFVVVVSL